MCLLLLAHDVHHNNTTTRINQVGTADFSEQPGELHIEVVPNACAFFVFAVVFVDPFRCIAVEEALVNLARIYGFIDVLSTTYSMGIMVYIYIYIYIYASHANRTGVVVRNAFYRTCSSA